MEEKLRAALHYGVHSSIRKDVDFIHQELSEKVQAGHVIVYPLIAGQGLPKRWLLPVSSIPQVGRQHHIIFDFTWSGLNEATAWEAPGEVMRFGSTLFRIIQRVLLADPWLGPI